MGFDIKPLATGKLIHTGETPPARVYELARPIAGHTHAVVIGPYAPADEDPREISFVLLADGDWRRPDGIAPHVCAQSYIAWEETVTEEDVSDAELLALVGITIAGLETVHVSGRILHAIDDENYAVLSVMVDNLTVGLSAMLTDVLRPSMAEA